MTIPSAVLLALLSSSAPAATSLEHASAITAELGFLVPVAAVSDPIPAPHSAAASGYVSGSGFVSGWMTAPCMGAPNHGGYRSGWVNLHGNINVYGPDGASGSIAVSGTAYLSGNCQNGIGSVSGYSSMSGSGTLNKDGHPVGTAQISANVSISGSGGMSIWINEYAHFSGSFTPAKAKP